MIDHQYNINQLHPHNDQGVSWMEINGCWAWFCFVNGQVRYGEATEKDDAILMANFHRWLIQNDQAVKATPLVLIVNETIVYQNQKSFELLGFLRNKERSDWFTNLISRHKKTLINDEIRVFDRLSLDIIQLESQGDINIKPHSVVFFCHSLLEAKELDLLGDKTNWSNSNLN